MMTSVNCKRRPRILLNPLSRIGILGAGVLLAPGVVLAEQTSPTVTTTFSSQSVYTDAITPVTDEVDDYLTTINAQLANGTQVFTETNPAPLSDSTVQAAIGAADAVLTSDGEVFSAPTLESTETALQSSTLTYVDGTPIFDSFSVASTVYVGPQTIYVGANQTQEFVVLAGTTDVDTLGTYDYTLPVSAVTTDTYLTTQSYLITGSVPEPDSCVMMLGGLGLLARRRRLRGMT